MPEVLTAEQRLGTVKTHAARAAGTPLIDESRISRRVRGLGRQISTVYAEIETPLVLVVILKGATVFAADLLRSLRVPAELEFVRAASYGTGTSSHGHPLRLARMVDGTLIDRHVLLVEDIVDSGRTLSRLMDLLSVRRPRSLAICALLHKHLAEHLRYPVRYVGFDAPNEFLVGYGLDHAENFRHLPYIASLQ